MKLQKKKGSPGPSSSGLLHSKRWDSFIVSRFWRGHITACQRHIQPGDTDSARAVEEFHVSETVKGCWMYAASVLFF